MGLSGHQAQVQLMVAVQQAGRVDDVRLVDGVDDIPDRRLRTKHLRGIDDDVEFGPLAALDQDARHPRQAVQPWLDLIGRELPDVGLRDRV